MVHTSIPSITIIIRKTFMLKSNEERIPYNNQIHNEQI